MSRSGARMESSSASRPPRLTGRPGRTVDGPLITGGKAKRGHLQPVPEPGATARPDGAVQAGGAVTDLGTFFKVSDRLPEHRKFVAAGGDAGWLWICGMGYASRNRTDGRIPANVVPRLSDRRQSLRLAAKLVEVDLWHRIGHKCPRCPQPASNEFIIHDYLDVNRSAERIREISAARAVSGAKGGSKRRAKSEQDGSNLLLFSSDELGANGTPDTGTETDLQQPAVAGAATPETEGQRANRLTRAYTDLVKLSNFPAIAKIVRKAMAEGCSDGQIEKALHALAVNKRPVTTATMLVEIYGTPAPASSNGSGHKPVKQVNFADEEYAGGW